jgi:1-acyl-sn-glycerol-3-phosphate acyltransferase
MVQIMRIPYQEIFYKLVRGYFVRSRAFIAEAPCEAPVIFIANHEQSFGPVAAMASLPKPLLPWVAHQITDRRLCPPYLEDDFVRPEVRLLPPLSTILARIIGRICVRIMHDIAAIPVYRQSRRIAETILQSVRRLEQGKRLLIFPEMPNQRWNDILCEFDTGFVAVAKTFFERTRTAVCFIPVAVNRRMRSLRLGAPVIFDPTLTYHVERTRIREELKRRICALYLEMEDAAGTPTPAREEAVPVG